MSHIIKAKGIVLRKIAYGDSSRIATILTEDAGKVSGIVKGAKSAKSRIGTLIDLFNHVEVVFYKKESRSVQVITQVSLLSYFINIVEDLTKHKYASASVEIIDKLTLEGETHKSLYKGLLRTLKLINGSKEFPGFHFIRFFIYVLSEIGYGLEIEKCSHCSKNLSGLDKVLFNHEHGFMCQECGEGYLISFEFSAELFNLLFCLTRRNFDKEYSQDDIKDLVLFLERYLAYHHSEFKNIKSLRIY